MWGWFDPVYLVFVAPAMLLALWAQWRVRSAYAEASRIRPRSGYSGAEAAQALLQAAGVPDVRIEPVEGFMSDHYVPGQHVLRLSPEVYAGRSLAALGIAAHESGHALQDASRYPLLVLRNGLVPLASVGSNLSWVILMVGFAMASMHLVLAGIVAFSLTVLFQVVNLPVEFDASRRARLALAGAGLIMADEDVYVKRVLDSVAAT
jgi:Zn-dependent membrane protease YugP